LAFSGSPALSRKLHQDRIFNDILSKLLQEIRSIKWSLYLRAMAEQSAKLSQSKHPLQRSGAAAAEEKL
jgi:hypothetical protein